jgi:hypothetical protein
MANTLQGTINWAQAFIQYSPLTAGAGLEPSVSIASMIRNTMMTAPMAWHWNRVEDNSKSTQVNVQDYVYNIANLGYIELVTLIDSSGKAFQMKDVYNYDAIAPLGSNSVPQRPQAAALVTNTVGVGFKLRFMGIPDDVYQIILTYQPAPPQFAAFTVTSVLTASGGNTVYNGISFSSTFLPIGSDVLVVGATNTQNNGTFQVVNVTSAQLTLNNPSGMAETSSNILASNQDWFPIPDSYSDIYNNLFLGEAMALVDDARSQVYRHRGVAAFLAKAEGLTDLQKNIFAQQWLAQGREPTTVAFKLQQVAQARGE